MPFLTRKTIHIFHKAICLLIFLNAALSLGQGEKRSLYFDHLTIEDRLSHNTVYAIIQDKNGYIWIGTQNGLNKYDGYSFKTYLTDSQTDTKNGFIGKSISSLLEDSQGNLWVATRKQGLNIKLNLSDQFQNLNHDSTFLPIQGYDISALYEDVKGNIWIGTVGGGILEINLKNKTSKHYTNQNSKLSSNLVFDIVQDSQGAIWTANAGAGLNRLESNGQFTQIHQPGQNSPNMNGYRKKLFLDGDFLWVGTEGTGLYRFDIKNQEYEHFTNGNGPKDLTSSVVRDIHKTSDGRLFIATDGGGLNIYDDSTGNILKFQAGGINALNSNALLCFWEDRTGNIWIGTYNGGINIYKSQKVWFEFYVPNLLKGEKLDHRSILSLHQTKNGNIWVGTDGGGLSLFDPESQSFTSTINNANLLNGNSLDGKVVKSIFEDSKGRLWFGYFGTGFNIYDPKTKSFAENKKIFGVSNPNLGSNVWAIAERKNGEIWVGSIGNGISVIPPNSPFFETYLPDPKDPNSIGGANIMTIFIDREDRVWIGTGDSGLDIWNDQTKTFQHFKHDPNNSSSISDNEIRTIFQDRKGNIWIGTEGGGLNKWLGNGKFEKIKKGDGLIANSVMGITEDDKGMLWITTFEGISRLNPVTNEIQNFDFHARLKSNQFNQMAILKAADGQLFFGGIYGLNAIHPEQLKEEKRHPKIIFTDFKVFNKSIPVGELPDGRVILDKPIEIAKEVNLNYLDNSFSIDFSAIDFTSPLENDYLYKMEGFDKNWRSTEIGQHSVVYTNLDPKAFIFKVKHKEEEIQLIVRIKPPFWQALWFRVAVLSLITGLISFGVYFFVMRREAAQRRKLLMAEREILKLKNEKLADEVTAKNSKLMYSSVQMAHKNEVLNNIKQNVKELSTEPNSKLRQVIRMLDKELKSEDYWNEFNLYFNQIDKDFGQALLAKHPELTSNDLRICALIRINLTTKEIASLLNISVRGVEQSRYRLKKRLGLGSEDNLAKYISSFKNDL